MKKKMKRDIIVPCIIAVIMTITFSFLSEGLSLIVTFVPAIPIALWLYFKTCYNRTILVSKVLPLYLLGIGFQLFILPRNTCLAFMRNSDHCLGGMHIIIIYLSPSICCIPAIHLGRDIIL